MNLESNDLKKNIEFLEKLPKIVGMFENKIIIKRFLPALLKALKVETLINPCLPAIFSICESPSFNISFSKDIWPKLKDLFKLRSLPAAAIYFLISKVQYIGEHISQNDFSQYFLNLICKAMDCNVPKIQFVVSNNLKFIAKSVDTLSFKNQIFPRMMQIVSTTNSKTLKIDMLNNIKSLYTKLDQNLINDKLLGTLEKVRKLDNNNDICMCICDIYLEIAKIVNLEGIANKILPNLISMLVSANITKNNFDKIMGLVRTYLDQIKNNRYNELINDGSTLNVDSLANKGANDLQLSSNSKEEDNFMDSLLASSKPITNISNANNKGTEEFLNNLIGNNSSSTFSTNNSAINNTSTNNKNNDFSFIGTNNNNNNNNNNNAGFDFDFGNNSSIKKNDLFAGVSTNNNYNMSSNNNNNDLFSNMTINKTGNNNNNNKEDLLNNLMNDLPSNNNSNNNNFGFGNNKSNLNNNNNFGFGNNSGFGNNNKSNNPFDLLDDNKINNNDDDKGGIGNTINFDFGLNSKSNNKQNNSSNFMNLNSNNNSNNQNNFGGLNFGFGNNNNMNNNMKNNASNDLFNFTQMGNNNNKANNNSEFNFF